MLYDLRPFQEEDFPFFFNNPKSLILYEPRLGKTVLGTKLILSDQNIRSALILCPKNALFVWRDHIIDWAKNAFPNKSVRVVVVKAKNNNGKAQRQALWKTERSADITIFIVTFAAFLHDTEFLLNHKLMFGGIIADEYHKYLKNRTTKSFEKIKPFAKFCRRFHALSGTSVSKMGPPDLFAILHLCDPKLFSSYWRFVGTFCEIIDGMWGKEVVGIRNVENWHQLLRRYARIRKRSECAPHMPRIQRSLLNIEMTAQQRKVYDQLQLDKYVFTDNGEVVVAASNMERTIRWRMLLCCPKTLDPTWGIGAAMEDLVERLLDEDNPDERHIVIFTPFTKAIPYFEAYLKENGFAVWTLSGGIDPEDLVSRTKLFRESKGIMLCSIKYAQAFSLEPAQASYFIGYEWDPNDNKQAEDRLIPQQGSNPINAFYYAHVDSVDQGIAAVVNMKQDNIDITLKGEDSYDKS